MSERGRGGSDEEGFREEACERGRGRKYSQPLPSPSLSQFEEECTATASLTIVK